MASSGIDYAGSLRASPREDYPDDKGRTGAALAPAMTNGSMSSDGKFDHTHRKLKARHIQMIGIGGTIGTALFVQIGKGLLHGGPASLFLAFTLWCTFVLAITVSTAEMVTYLPISSPFLRFAGRFVDEALEFSAGWNYFVFEAVLVPYEVTACNFIIHYWSDAVPAGGIIAIVIVLYALINTFAVKWYGESEFWAALGKVVLATGLIIFTFIVMVGGNPLHDTFGFRYWYEPGSFNTRWHDGDLGRFQGFLACFIMASFTVAGPDYVSMAAGEAENPRTVMPKAFNAVFYRLTTFFSIGALCVGILVPYDDAEMTAAFDNSLPGAAASPYVVAMNRLQIPVLPHIVNALILTACFSAGNSYVYCASRSLYGMALEGKAPKFLAVCTKSGVPVYSVLVVLAFAMLSFLQLSNNASIVLSWITSLVTASQLINYAVICATYLCFYRALKAQGISRDTLPYKAVLQPFAAWYGLIGCSVMAILGGYEVFIPGNWDLPTFLFSYMMIFICPVLFIGWKLIHRTRFRRPATADLIKNLAEIEEHERLFVPTPPKNFIEKVFNFLFN